MALTGLIVADGVTGTLTGVVGNLDLNIRMTSGTYAHVWLQVSYDAGATWQNLADLGNSSCNKILVAGSSAAVYRFKVIGITAPEAVSYYLGQD